MNPEFVYFAPHDFDCYSTYNVQGVDEEGNEGCVIQAFQDGGKTVSWQ
jgi:hypothetical protein